MADDDAHSLDRTGDPAHWATGRLLSTAARLVEHAWDAHLATWGLNHASFAVLWMLERGPLPQRSLASSASVQDQTMSRIVERLQRLGYVERARGTDDRRQVLVHHGDVRCDRRDDGCAASRRTSGSPKSW